MSLPFTRAQFLALFKSYNLAVWPMQVVAYLLAGGVLALILTNRSKSRRAAWGLLAFFWLWNGMAYHLLFFRAINRAAIGFGILFLLQSGLFVWAGLKRPDLAFRPGTSPRALAGSLLLLYSMLAYPLLGAMQGHGYPLSPSFGLTPCPTVIFTFGLLLWTEGKVPAFLLIIPFLWALVGFNAALRLGILEDTGLLVAGLVGVPLLLVGNPGPGTAGERGGKTGPEPERLPSGAVPRPPLAPGH